MIQDAATLLELDEINADVPNAVRLLGAEHVVLGSRTGKLSIYGREGLAIVSEFQLGESRIVEHFALPKREDEFVAVMESGSIKTCRLAADAIETVNEFDANGLVASATMLGTGATLAVGYLDGRVGMVDMKTSQIRAKQAHQEQVFSIAASDRLGMIATGGGDNDIVLWETNSLDRIAVLKGHTSAVFGVAFHPNGRRLASVGFDQRVRIWDLPLRTELFSLPMSIGLAAAFSPDGQRLAVGSTAGMIWTMDATPSDEQVLDMTEVPVKPANE